MHNLYRAPGLAAAYIRAIAENPSPDIDLAKMVSLWELHPALIEVENRFLFRSNLVPSLFAMAANYDDKNEAHRAALEAGLGNPALVTVSEEMAERGEIFVTFNSEQYIPLPFMAPLFYSIVEAAPEFTPVLSLVEVSDALLLDLAQIESDGVRH